MGVANGLAWTSVGGEILPIEVQIVRGGSGKLELTGSLGEVMKESAKACHHLCESARGRIWVSTELFKNADIASTRQRGPSRRTGPVRASR